MNIIIALALAWGGDCVYRDDLGSCCSQHILPCYQCTRTLQCCPLIVANGPVRQIALNEEGWEPGTEFPAEIVKCKYVIRTCANDGEHWWCATAANSTTVSCATIGMPDEDPLCGL
jgi:hypothetical protein